MNQGSHMRSPITDATFATPDYQWKKQLSSVSKKAAQEGGLKSALAKLNLQRSSLRPASGSSPGSSTARRDRPTLNK
jgi:hypothetical protein